MKIGYEDNNDIFVTISIYIMILMKVFRGYFIRFVRRANFSGVVLIGRRVSIIGRAKHLNVGHGTKIEQDCIVQTIANYGITLGSFCTIGQGTMIRPSSLYRGTQGEGFSMGNGSAIGVYSYIGCAGNIIIGNNVLAGPRLTLIAENHLFDSANIDIKDQGVSQQGIIIEDNVWIGANVTILDGVTVSRGAIIAAGAVVIRSVPPYAVVAGVPAVIKRVRE
ncbi:hypothetical protein SOASR032_24300 [Pragia fontium]|uniref:Acyltransferase n=1 Tax=Pragia fontium TaxID=82985 RepID=A0ABQ5LJR8_9GAMM|nr:acyltransferase [Pragia fontium]GKX63861.1 hypothetical protein SOASR032_24300 [Pragia fontium]